MEFARSPMCRPPPVDVNALNGLRGKEAEKDSQVSRELNLHTRG